MIIKTLVENKSTDPKIKAQHGLSLYIEADNHKILFDLGGGNLFIENAKKLGVEYTVNSPYRVFWFHP